MKVVLNDNRFKDTDYYRILAVDPGKTIGLCKAELHRVKGSTWEMLLTTATLQWPGQVEALEKLLVFSDALIVETWRLRANTAKSLIGSDMVGPQVVGYLVGWATLNDRQVTWQHPADAMELTQFVKSNIPDEQWPRTEHERDAIKHVIAYLLRGK